MNLSILRLLVGLSILQFIVIHLLKITSINYHAIVGTHMLIGFIILILSYITMFVFKKKYGNCFGATALAGAITLQFIIGVIFYLPSSPVSLEQILRLLHLIIGLTVLSLAVALRVRFTHQSNSK
jgi:arginine exporter protein ArgO|tara:strand:- start:1892 stop:2266 length:375 start_codon:yes stop_codon:yes gene_type:complete